MKPIEVEANLEALCESASRLLIHFSRMLGELIRDPDQETPIPAVAYLDRIVDLRERCEKLLSAAEEIGREIPTRQILVNFDSVIEMLACLIAESAEVDATRRAATLDRCRSQVSKLLLTLNRARQESGVLSFPRCDRSTGVVRVPKLRLQIALAEDLRWLDCAHPDRTLVSQGTLLPHDEVLVDRRSGRSRPFSFSCGPKIQKIPNRTRLSEGNVLIALRIDWIGLLTLESVAAETPETRPALAGPIALPIRFCTAD